jgi:arabinoxylan arabinofuranohydrolase
VVNGKSIDIPANPVRSTNANGIVGYDLYETKVTLPANTNQIPVVSASADNNSVKVAVEQAVSTSGTAVVKCDYKGIVKTYKIVFAAE